MNEVMNAPVGMSGSTLALLVLLWTLAIIAVVYWWARKSTKHPEYAAKIETKYIDPALRAVGLDDLAARSAVADGQKLYVQAQVKADELEATAKALLIEAKQLRDRVRPPQN
jgi:hypothetical protein